MRYKHLAILLLAFLFLSGTTASACSPTMESFMQPYSDKVAAASTVFIGRVLDVGPDFVEFEVGTAGKGSAAVGEKVRLVHAEYGTCGKHDFKKGEVWLYAGDQPFSPSRQLSQESMGGSIENVVLQATLLQSMMAAGTDNTFKYCTQDNDCALTTAICTGDALSVRKGKEQEAADIIEGFRKITPPEYGCSSAEVYAAQQPQVAKCMQSYCSSAKAE